MVFFFFSLSLFYQMLVITSQWTQQTAASWRKGRWRDSEWSIWWTWWCVVTTLLCIKPKPDAYTALKICSRLGVEPRNAVFIGDTPTDAMCGRNANCGLAISELWIISPNNNKTPSANLGSVWPVSPRNSIQTQTHHTFTLEVNLTKLDIRAIYTALLTSRH